MTTSRRYYTHLLLVYDSDYDFIHFSTLIFAHRLPLGPFLMTTKIQPCACVEKSGSLDDDHDASCRLLASCVGAVLQFCSEQDQLSLPLHVHTRKDLIPAVDICHASCPRLSPLASRRWMCFPNPAIHCRPALCYTRPYRLTRLETAGVKSS